MKHVISQHISSYAVVSYLEGTRNLLAALSESSRVVRRRPSTSETGGQGQKRVQNLSEKSGMARAEVPQK